MYDVLKVVDWLRVRNNAELKSKDYAEELTQMKAMKLLYYIQGASLVVLNKRLFPDNLVAWRYGPAVEAVHEKYQGKREIVGEIDRKSLDNYNELSSDEEASTILNSVYEAFGDKSAAELMRQTHNESPWKETAQSEVIKDEAMRKFFITIVTTDDN